MCSMAGAHAVDTLQCVQIRSMCLQVPDGIDNTMLMLLSGAPLLPDLSLTGQVDRSAFSYCRFFGQITSLDLQAVRTPST